MIKQKVFFNHIRNLSSFKHDFYLLTYYGKKTAPIFESRL